MIWQRLGVILSHRRRISRHKLMSTWLEILHYAQDDTFLAITLEKTDDKTPVICY